MISDLSFWQLLFYFRLRKYINDSPEPYRQDLQKILYPMFIQIYLELLLNSHKTQGKN
jgi:hypothetical protein